MRSVLVTGAAGFIGGNVFRHLRAGGHDVVGVDTRARARSGICRADACDPGLVEAIGRGRFAVVVHQAAITNTLAPEDDSLAHANVRTTEIIAKACSVSHTRLVHASSASVYGTPVGAGGAFKVGDESDRSICTGPLNPYARSKLAAEEAIYSLSDDLNWLAFRYTNVFGPGDEKKGDMAAVLSKMVRAASSGQPIEMFADALTATRDFVPIDQVTLAAELALRGDALGIFNLGSGVSFSFAALASAIHSLLNGPPVSLRLVENPIQTSYQYSTAVHMESTYRALPRLPTLTEQDILASIKALLKRYQS